jgi:multimeric flavodoxin WrbA
MNITTILGSPRLSGNTATILKSFEEIASKSYDINRINIKNQMINGCLGCNACQKKMNTSNCIQSDDANKIFEGIMQSDIIIYASPVYVWDFTSQMKALLDRHYCLVKWKNIESPISLLKNKNSILLATCGGDVKNNADLIKEVFRREMDYLQCNLFGIYIVPNCSTPSALKDKSKTIAQNIVNDIGNKINIKYVH